MKLKFRFLKPVFELMIWFKINISFLFFRIMICFSNLNGFSFCSFFKRSVKHYLFEILINSKILQMNKNNYLNLTMKLNKKKIK